MLSFYRLLQPALLGAILLPLMFACKPVHTTAYVSRQTYPTGPGPEDIYPDTVAGQPVLWVSCASRRDTAAPYGEIHLFSPRQGDLGPVPRSGEPEGLHFRPHGIFLQTVNGLKNLYVISHDDEADSHVVIRYTAHADGLKYVQTYADPKLVSPNALAVFPSGELLVGNDSRKRGSMLEKLFKRKVCEIIYFTPDGQASVAGGRISYANGIAIREGKVWIAATTGNRIYRFNFEDGKLTDREKIAKLYGPDNLRWHNDQLITACHPRLFKFIAHVKDAEKPSPTQIYSIHPRTGETKILYGEKGNFIPAASTGVFLNGKLWISQVFNPFLAGVELKKEDSK